MPSSVSSQDLHVLRPGATEAQPVGMVWRKKQHVVPIVFPPSDIKKAHTIQLRYEEFERNTVSAVPTAILIQNLTDDRLRLRRPLRLRIEKEGNFYVAVNDEFEELGYGYDPIQALDDFRQTLAELYWTLKSEQSRLAIGLANLWSRLKQTVEEL